MRRKIFYILLLFCVLKVSAQQSLGIQVAFVEPILRMNSGTNTSALSDKIIQNGAKVGVIYDATLIKGFGMTMGLNYSFCGTSTSWKQVGTALYPQKRNRYIIHTLELPIDWQYKFKIADDTYIIVYTGPTIQYNVSFKQRTDIRDISGIGQKPATTQGDWNNRYKQDTDNDGNADFSPLNIMWGVGAGFQYKNYYLRGGYDFGIYNQYRDRYNDAQDYTMRARLDSWSIRLGIYFLNF